MQDWSISVSGPRARALELKWLLGQVGLAWKY